MIIDYHRAHLLKTHIRLHFVYNGETDILFDEMLKIICIVPDDVNSYVGCKSNQPMVDTCTGVHVVRTGRVFCLTRIVCTFI